MRMLLPMRAWGIVPPRTNRSRYPTDAQIKPGLGNAQYDRLNGRFRCLDSHRILRGINSTAVPRASQFVAGEPRRFDEFPKSLAQQPLGHFGDVLAVQPLLCQTSENLYHGVVAIVIC